MLQIRRQGIDPANKPFNASHSLQFTNTLRHHLYPFAKIRQVSPSAAKLVHSITIAGGSTVPVDRRPNSRTASTTASSPDIPRAQSQNRSNMTEIVSIHAREILDSRGNPTVEADVVLDRRHPRPRRRPLRRLHRRARSRRTPRRRQGPLPRQRRPQGRRKHRDHPRPRTRRHGRSATSASSTPP